MEGLVPISVDQGETASFRVRTEGSVKTVKWYKNGKELAAPKSKDLGNGVYELTVPDAKEDDAADYKVFYSLTLICNFQQLRFTKHVANPLFAKQFP